AVDLGWKLAAVLQGWGGARLIESYDAERRPVGTRNVQMATSFYQHNEAFAQWSPQLEEDSAAGERARHAFGEALVSKIGSEFRTLGLQIGYAYENSPICVDDGSAPPPHDPATYVPNARPGARAPHVWIGDGVSTLDLFGRGFVLMRFAGAPAADAIAQAAAARNVPLTVRNIGSEEAAAIYANKLVLVRPDGHVAWRADAAPADPGALIERVRGA
ncbi:MAG: FAD-dependent monooxygenase, partial [Pseudolabrys sp.]